MIKQKQLRVLQQLDDRIVPAGGLFDTNFSTDGKVFITPAATSSYEGGGTAVDADGKIVVVSTRNDATSTSIVVARYAADGAADTSFDVDGFLSIGLAGTKFRANGVAIQPDGKIVVVGSINSSTEEDFFVARLNTDGSFDTTFDTDGQTSIVFDIGGGNNDRAQAVALQADGKIVIVGSVQAGATDYDFGIARLDTDGSLDTSFDANGIRTVEFDLGGNNKDEANAVAIDAAGNIVIVGSAETTMSSSDFALVRLLPDGSYDATFDTDGKVSTSFGGDDRARALTFTTDNKIVVAGSWDSGAADFAVARYTTNGDLDVTFGGGSFPGNSGKTNASFATTGFGEAEFATGVALDGFGRILVSGYTDNNIAGGPNNFGVIRFLADGSTVDLTYGLDGRSQADMGGNDKAIGAVQQADGRLVLVGTSDTKLALARITGDEADLGVTILSTGNQFQLGSLVEYTVTVSNFGTEPTVGTLSVDLTPEIVASNFTSTVSAGTVTGNTDGNGVPADTLVLDVGGQVVYRILARIDSVASLGAFTPSASITNISTFDADLTDNTDSEADNVSELLPVLVGGPINGLAVPLTPNSGVLTVGSSTSYYASTTTRTASADVNGDGIADQIVGPGPGQQSRIRVVNGATGLDITPSWLAFEEAFTGGVFVAARDLNGDSKAEVIVTPDVSGGAVVVVYDGDKLASGLNGENAQIVRFFGINDPAFRGGARPAIGDVNGDGVADVLIAAGFGGGPRVTFWDGNSVLSKAPVELANFFAFETALRNGAYIASGDVDADGIDDVSFGGGPGGAPRVRIYTGTGLVSAVPFVSLDDLPGAAQIANFFAGDNTLRGGVRLTMKDVDADGRADLITGSGDNEPAAVRLFNANDLIALPLPTATQTLSLFGGVTLLDGVYVG